MSKSLVELGREYGAHKRERTLLAYEREFYWFKNKQITLLEIGVKRGGSLKVWHAYFRCASIVGVDRRLVKPIEGISDRVRIERGDQGDIAFMTRVVDQHGPFDIVIEDGSHQLRHQQENFEFLFPHVNPGGLYTMEDIHTSYRPEYYADWSLSSVDYVKALVEYVNIHSGKLAHQSEFLAQHGGRIDKIVFAQRTAIIQKRGESLAPVCSDFQARFGPGLLSRLKKRYFDSDQTSSGGDDR